MDIFKFNVSFDKRIPEERVLAEMLENIPSKRRGHLVRTLIMESVAHRQASGRSLTASYHVSSAPIGSIENNAESAELPMPPAPSIKSNLFGE